MSETPAKYIVFAGPTAYACARPRLLGMPAILWRPPVQRGDIEQLLCTMPPAQIAIVDGRFQQCLSVGHMELRRAIEQGWTVWGLSSIGAIRAYEMRDYGMRGFGRVYQRFL